MERVFVVGTGRCASSTFYAACQHITNYTCGHESHAGKAVFPSYHGNHIEVDSALVAFMPCLKKQYRDAKWVMIERDRDVCVRSLAKCVPDAVKAWSRLYCRTDTDVTAAAGLYYDMTNATIRSLLPVGSMLFPVSYAKPMWREFWDWIGAEGDFDASVAEWDRRYNAGVARGRDMWVGA